MAILQGFVCPLERGFELHFDLVLTLCEFPVPLVALFDDRRRVPAWGIWLRFDEDALAAHVFFGEIQVRAVDWAGCQEIWHATCSFDVEPTADEGVFVSRHECEGYVRCVGVLGVVHGEGCVEGAVGGVGNCEEPAFFVSALQGVVGLPGGCLADVVDCYYVPEVFPMVKVDGFCDVLRLRGALDSCNYREPAFYALFQEASECLLAWLE